MKKFNFDANLFPLRSLKLISAQSIQTILHTMISSGQCTQAMTLERFMSITQGRKAQNNLLNPERNRAVRNATETLA